MEQMNGLIILEFVVTASGRKIAARSILLIRLNKESRNPKYFIIS